MKVPGATSPAARIGRVEVVQVTTIPAPRTAVEEPDLLEPTNVAEHRQVGTPLHATTDDGRRRDSTVAQIFRRHGTRRRGAHRGEPPRGDQGKGGAPLRVGEEHRPLDGG